MNLQFAFTASISQFFWTSFESHHRRERMNNEGKVR